MDKFLMEVFETLGWFYWTKGFWIYHLQCDKHLDPKSDRDEITPYITILYIYISCSLGHQCAHWCSASNGSRPTASSTNGPISQIPQCTISISHNAPYCNRNVHTRRHFCYKMMHCRICYWCMVELVQQVYYKVRDRFSQSFRDH